MAVAVIAQVRVIYPIPSVVLFPSMVREIKNRRLK
jgi:hypothetical protein